MHGPWRRGATTNNAIMINRGTAGSRRRECLITSPDPPCYLWAHRGVLCDIIVAPAREGHWRTARYVGGF